MASRFSKIERAKARLVIQDPFYATILLDMPTVQDTSIPTAQTDGTEIRVNPEWMDTLPLDQVVGVLKHECMHVAGLHMFRRESKDPEKWNKACDAVINDRLVNAEGNVLPEGGIDVPGARQYSPEQYYNLLPDNKGKGSGDQSGQGQGQGHDQSQGQGESQGQDLGQGQGQDAPGDPLAGDVKPAPDQSELAKSKAKATVARARNAAKARGLMPEGLDAEIDELLNSAVDWRVTLRRFLTERSEDDYSLAQPDRRFVADDLFLPGRMGEDAMGEMVAIIDTSASVSDGEIGQFFGELGQSVAEVSPERLVAIYCDSEVTHVDEFEQPSQAEVTQNRRRYGGGGTKLTAALDYADENYPDAKAYVVFTDGGTNWGDPRSTPTLWAITTDRTAPWGETVQVDMSNK